MVLFMILNALPLELLLLDNIVPVIVLRFEVPNDSFVLLLDIFEELYFHSLADVFIGHNFLHPLLLVLELFAFVE